MLCIFYTHFFWEDRKANIILTCSIILLLKILYKDLHAELKFLKIYISRILRILRLTVEKSVQEDEVTTSPIGHANLSWEENGIDMLTEANLKVNGL